MPTGLKTANRFEIISDMLKRSDIYLSILIIPKVNAKMLHLSKHIPGQIHYPYSFPKFGNESEAKAKIRHLSQHLPGPNITLVISESKCKDATFISASSGAENYPYLYSKVKAKMRQLSKYLPEPNINLINFRR